MRRVLRRYRRLFPSLAIREGCATAERLLEDDMRFLAAVPVFFRLYGFHRRGGKQVAAAVRLSARAFESPFYR